jgi:hypothetical protein
VYLLYDHVIVLIHSGVQILVVLLIFVAMEFLSPYLRKSLHLSSLWRFLPDYILTSDKRFYPHCKTRFLVFVSTLHIAPLVFYIRNFIIFLAFPFFISIFID